jgi:hypothetical protein
VGTALVASSGFVDFVGKFGRTMPVASSYFVESARERTYGVKPRGCVKVILDSAV